MARAALVIAALAALLTIPLTASANPDDPDPDRVLVRGEEFDLTLSKPKVRPGRVIVQFLNGGEDPHDLRLQRLRDGQPYGTELGTGELGSGAVENLDVQLKKRSEYVLWCSIQDHRGRGMEATLRTKKRKRRV
ncbi:MAG: hypothetical protein ACXWZM_09880 [Solirubrobacterales bacterium]